MDKQLEVFVQVVEAQSFSKAAEQLFMTQPAVSQYIRLLEENIGVKLLDRTSKYVRLNQAGEIVYHHAKEITALYMNMQLLVDDLINQATGSLSIGASLTFGEYILPHIIAEMHQTYPNIDTIVTIGNTEEIADLVLHHQLDIGIVEGHFKKENQMTIKDFLVDQMVIVAPANHPLATHEHVPVQLLAKENWLLREIGSGTREATDYFLQQYQISPQTPMYLGSTQAIKEAVSAGLGISLLSRWAIQKELQYGILKIIMPNIAPVTRNFSIITKGSFQSKALQIFIHLLHHNKTMQAMESE